MRSSLPDADAGAEIVQICLKNPGDGDACQDLAVHERDGDGEPVSLSHPWRLGTPAYRLEDDGDTLVWLADENERSDLQWIRERDVSARAVTLSAQVHADLYPVHEEMVFEAGFTVGLLSDYYLHSDLDRCSVIVEVDNQQPERSREEFERVLEVLDENNYIYTPLKDEEWAVEVTDRTESE
jgi:hypothetical protein